MEKNIKKVRYLSTNSYETLNVLSSTTKNVWMVFHGMGYLSRYFLKYFQHLNSKENYVIAPQAPSKYYLNGQFKHVGASWLTREDTLLEIGNVLDYVDKVWASEEVEREENAIVFGFSQGVSIALRWLVRNKRCCKKLILYAGGIPKELTKDDLMFLTTCLTKVFLVYGNKDPYLSEERLEAEIQRAHELFGASLEVITFQGGHEIRPDILLKLGK